MERLPALRQAPAEKYFHSPSFSKGNLRRVDRFHAIGKAAYRNEQYIPFFHVRDVYFLFETKEKKMIVVLFFIR